jgi:hypothetical protein
MTANRTFGLLILIFSGLLLWFISTGILASAPLLLAFGLTGGVTAALLSIWLIVGRF